MLKIVGYSDNLVRCNRVVICPGGWAVPLPIPVRTTQLPLALQEPGEPDRSLPEYGLSWPIRAGDGQGDRSR
jgi:hypothetical protein